MGFFLFVISYGQPSKGGFVWTFKSYKRSVRKNFWPSNYEIHLIWGRFSTTFKLLLWFLFMTIQGLVQCIPLFLFVFIKVTLGARNSVLPRISYLYCMHIFLLRYLFFFSSSSISFRNNQRKDLEKKKKFVYFFYLSQCLFGKINLVDLFFRLILVTSKTLPYARVFRFDYILSYTAVWTDFFFSSAGCVI